MCGDEVSLEPKCPECNEKINLYLKFLKSHFFNYKKSFLAEIGPLYFLPNLRAMKENTTELYNIL